MTQHTKDKLADALRAIGLDDMAEAAARGYYHDFLSPLDTPCIQLVSDLRATNKYAARDLAKRVINGEFDETKEEGDDWLNSTDGMEAYRRLFSRIARRP